MAGKKIKFVWKESAAIPGTWKHDLWAVYDRGHGKHHEGLAISVRTVLRGLGVLAVAGYLMAATALFFWLERSPYNTRSWLDVVTWPVRRQHMAQLHARALIAEGQDDIKARRWDVGVFRLNAGLALVQDRKARLTLSQYYLLLNNSERSLEILKAGLESDYPGRPYLERVFELAERTESFAAIDELAVRYADPKTGADERERAWLRSRRIRALMLDQQFDRALELLDTATTDASSLAKEQRVMALLGAKRPADALEFLTAWGAMPGAARDQVVRLRVRALRDAGRIDDMVAALNEFREISPGQPQAYIYAVVQCAMARDVKAADAALADFLFRYGNKPETLLPLAAALAEIADLRRLEVVVKSASEHGHVMKPFLISLFEGQLTRGEWLAAQQTLGKLRPLIAADNRGEQLWLEWSTRLSEATVQTADNAQTELIEFLRGRILAVKIFRTTIEVLRRADRLQTAADALNVARRAYPGSNWLRSSNTEVLDAIAAQAPAAPVPIAAAAGPVTEKVFFRQLDAAMAAGNWAEARRMIADVRSGQVAPPWLGGRTSDLTLAEMKAARALGETPAMMSAARQYLDGSATRANTILTLARELRAAGQVSEASALVSAVLTNVPEYAPAVRLRTEWRAEKK